MARGWSLRNHWGVQALQFFSIWLAWRWNRQHPIDLTRLLCVALLIHAASLAWYAVEHRDPRPCSTAAGSTRCTPHGAWHARPSRTGARPPSVRCGTWPARSSTQGWYRFYSGGSLEVFDTESATPWVRPEDLHLRGAVYVLDEGDPVPPGVTDVVAFKLVPGDRSGRPAKTIKLGILRPAQSCD